MTHSFLLTSGGQKNMNDVASKLAALAAPVAEDLGLSVWDADFSKEGSAFFLTLYIDREDGVSIDDCEKVSRALDPLLETLGDASLPPYVFSVSSAGIEKRLTKPVHFEKSLGKPVELTFYRPMDGQKSVVGTLSAFDGAALTLDFGTSEKTVYQRADIASARIHFDF